MWAFPDVSATVARFFSRLTVLCRIVVAKYVARYRMPARWIIGIEAFNGDQRGDETYSEAFRADVDLDDIRREVPWGETCTVHVTYTHAGKTYTAVYQPSAVGETFPPRKPMGVRRRSPVEGAVLVRNDGFEDVTDTVRQYAGPDHDFHDALGLTVHPRDMFPWEDHDTLETLVIRTRDGETTVLRLQETT
jgi:hypothetical protein